jgi:DnaK suppressor protein
MIETARYRRMLVERLAATRAGLASSRDALAPVALDQASVGRLSRMDALQQQATRAGLREGQQREERRIEAALARLDAGQFGVCCACEDDIAEERLAADPATPFCLACAAARAEKAGGH